MMHFISLNEINIAFERICPTKVVDENTLLVFLHEALGSIAQWKEFPEGLCEELKVNGVIYERQGHGASSPLDKPRTSRYLHDYAYHELYEFLKCIAPSKRIFLVGHSDGGSIALLYASKFPDNIIGVVTLAAHVINEPETRAGIPPAIQAFENGKLNGLFKYHGVKTKTLFDAWSVTWLSESFKGWNICEELRSIQCPVLAIQGTEDQYGTIEQLNRMKNFIQSDLQSEFIPAIGHHPHLEASERILRMIASFFQNKLNI
jgi:pimeloyl-ACP methyl ester carboxylesterase